MTRNPDTLPTSTDPTGPCPHCGRISNFGSGNSLHLAMLEVGPGVTQPATQVVQLRCMGCRRSSIVIEKRERAGAPLEPILWWPTPGLAGVDRAVIPSKVADAYDEGVRCLAIQAPNAAVAMLRNALAQIVQDKGSEQAKAKGTLNGAIEQMVSEKTLWETFGTWAHSVRQMGNAGAHQESYADVTVDEAESVRALIGAMIDFLYIQHAKVLNAAPPQKRTASP